MRAPWSRDLWIWVLAIFAVLSNAALDSYNIARMERNEEGLAHCRKVKVHLLGLLSAVKDAETGHRGYLLTGEDAYLAPFHQSQDEYRRHWRAADQLTRSQPAQQTRLRETDRLVAKKVDELNRTIEIRNRQGLAVAAGELASGPGKDYMDDIRQTVAAALDEEDELLHARERITDEGYRTAQVTNLIAAALALGIVVAAASMVGAELKRRLKAREDLAALAESLERTVQERTALLQTSNEDLEKFASIASHDLQEPLRKIQAFGDRLLKKHLDRLDIEGQDALRRILDATGRMRRLIDDLLAFSRVASSGQPFAPVPLAEILEEVKDVFEVRLQEMGGRLEIGELPEVTGDAWQLRQLFQNLVGNALKFARPGVSPEIGVNATPFESLPTDAHSPAPDGPGWRITVRDNGIGFEPQYAERIFELFQRLHGRGTYDGTGLGLAIVRRIVQRHGATIVARGKPDEGAAFLIDWPAKN